MWIYVPMLKNLLSAGIEQKMYYQDCSEWHTRTGCKNLIPFIFFYSGSRKLGGLFKFSNAGYLKLLFQW